MAIPNHKLEYCNRILRITLLSAASFFSAAIAPAFASEPPATNALRFSCEAEAHFFSVNSLDMRLEGKAPPQRDDLFINSSQDHKTEIPVPVTRCELGGTTLNLSRVFLNVPDHSGRLCATLDWAVFQLSVDDRLIAEFISGCSEEIHLFTTRFNIHFCKSDFNRTDCKTVSWPQVLAPEFAPIRIGLLGNWL